MIGYVPFHVWPPREKERMLCIGAGGGLDVLIGHTAGMKEIIAVDINRALPSWIEQFKGFHGDVYGMAGTKLIVAEGRNFLAQQEKPFDVIYLALTQTATASGTGMALAESYIHTVEAFAEALRHLTPDGKLVMIFQEEPSLQRALLTAREAVDQVQGTSDDGRYHLVALSEPSRRMEPYNHLLIVKRSRLTENETETIKKVAREIQYQVQFLPGRPVPNPSSEKNLRPVHDDNPFFLDLSFGVPPAIRWLLIFSGVVSVGLAMGIMADSPSRSATTPPFLVLLIGVGYMLVQNVMVQRFILLLGYPTLALSVVIFGMLIGGSLGSLAAQRWGDRDQWNRVVWASLLAIPLLLLVNYAVPRLVTLWLVYPLAARIALTMGWVIPVGFTLGIFFPTTLRLTEGPQIPWLWAINGTASVAGGALTISLAKWVNFSLALNVAILCYGVAVVLLWRWVRVRRSFPPV